MLLAFALLLAGCGDDPQGIVVTPASYDFGRVEQGHKPEAKLRVTNHTDRVVSVMPQPNCSCFLVERGRSLRPLDPGDSMDVHVMFDTTAKPPGPVQGKFVTFHFDHPTHRKQIVPLQGEIYRSFDLRPQEIDLGRIDGRPRNYEARTITIEPRRGYKVAVKKVVANPDVFTIRTRAGERSAVLLDVALRKDIKPRPLGRFEADLRLELEVTPTGGEPFGQRPRLKIKGSWAIKADGTPVR